MGEYAVTAADGAGSDDGSAPTTVLLCGSGDPTGEMWGPLWSQRDPQETNLLAVTCKQTPVELLDAWEEQIGDLPVKMGVIRIGQSLDSSVDLDRSEHEGISLPLTAVERPSDIGELYTAITLYATEWLYTDQRTIIWLESLTPLLRHVGIQRTLDFVERLGDRLAELDATVYFRLDPAVHEPDVIELLRSSFDLVVESDDRSAPLPDGLLADRRRRTLLRALRAAGGSLPIEDGAARIAAHENDHHADGVEPVNARLVAIDLQHGHLPKLEEAGLLEVDRERRIVDLSVPSARIDTYLRRVGRGSDSTDANGDVGEGDEV